MPLFLLLIAIGVLLLIIGGFKGKWSNHRDVSSKFLLLSLITAHGFRIQRFRVQGLEIVHLHFKVCFSGVSGRVWSCRTHLYPVRGLWQGALPLVVSSSACWPTSKANERKVTLNAEPVNACIS
jgi:hypothetical protein